MTKGYIDTFVEFWKPQLLGGNIFLYVFYFSFGLAVALFIYQLYRWKFYKERPYWAFWVRDDKEVFKKK